MRGSPWHAYRADPLSAERGREAHLDTVKLTMPTLILPRVTRAAENLESRAQGEGSNPCTVQAAARGRGADFDVLPPQKHLQKQLQKHPRSVIMFALIAKSGSSLSNFREERMAVASVTKITAASSEGFDAAVREGLARDRPSRNRAQGERGERKNRGVPGDDGGDLHPRKLMHHRRDPLAPARAKQLQ